MLTARCPHCGTRQAESSRCWVCKRPFTSCATCLHFRRSVAGPAGYCGKDRARLPLTGDEMRACWVPLDEGPPLHGLFASSDTVAPLPGPTTVRPRIVERAR